MSFLPPMPEPKQSIEHLGSGSRAHAQLGSINLALSIAIPLARCPLIPGRWRARMLVALQAALTRALARLPREE